MIHFEQTEEFRCVNHQPVQPVHVKDCNFFQEHFMQIQVMQTSMVIMVNDHYPY